MPTIILSTGHEIDVTEPKTAHGLRARVEEAEEGVMVSFKNADDETAYAAPDKVVAVLP